MSGLSTAESPALALLKVRPRRTMVLLVPAPGVQVVGSSEDGKLFDGEDAQLVLNKGTPRFYIMRLPKRGLRFHRITYHQQCTQCLGGLRPPGRYKGGGLRFHHNNYHQQCTSISPILAPLSPPASGPSLVP